MPHFGIIFALLSQTRFGPTFGRFVVAIIYRKRAISEDRWITREFPKIADNLPLSEAGVFRTLIAARNAPFLAPFTPPPPDDLLRPEIWAILILDYLPKGVIFGDK